MVCPPATLFFIKRPFIVLWVLLALFFYISPQSAHAAVLNDACNTRTDVSGFSCPTATGYVCGIAPNLSCPTWGSVPVCSGGQAFDCYTCACQCQAGWILCGTTCITPYTGSCAPGQTFDQCTGNCIGSAYVLLSPATNSGGVTLMGMSQMGSNGLALGSGQNLLYGLVSSSSSGGNLLMLQKGGGNTVFNVDLNGSLTSGSVPWARLASYPTSCSAGQYVSAVGSSLTCSTPDAITGSGSANYMPKFTGSKTIGNSLLYDNGSYLQMTSPASISALIQNTNAVNNSIALWATASATGGTALLGQGGNYGLQGFGNWYGTFGRGGASGGYFEHNDSLSTWAYVAEKVSTSYYGIAAYIGDGKTGSAGSFTRVGSPTMSAQLAGVSGASFYAGNFQGDVWITSGKLGVGTTTPTQAIDVNGTIKTTGFQLGSSATAGHVLTANASGVGTWQALPAGVTGSGTIGTLAKFNGSTTTLGDSMIAENSPLASMTIGSSNTATGTFSYAIGVRDDATANGAMAIGGYVAATAAGAIAIGGGIDVANKMTNSVTNSLGVGFSSTVPTLFVGPGSGAGTYGNVGIGTSAPGALLNVRQSAPSGAGGVPANTSVLLDSSSNNYLTFRNSADNASYAGLQFLDNNVGGYVAFRNWSGSGKSDSLLLGTYQDIYFQTGTSGTVDGKTDVMTIKQGGNVGIGNTAPGYKLHVMGSIYADGGWLRTSGAAGWYSESYGGGWYMTDASWIRGYNGKSLWMGGGLIGGDGGLTVGYGGTGSPTGGAIIAGKVGIGKTDPVGKLDVYQGTGVGVSWSSGLNIYDGANRLGIIEDATVARFRNEATGGYQFYNSAGTAALFTIANSGSVSSSSTVNGTGLCINGDCRYSWSTVADKVNGFGSNPDNSHPGSGARPFYSWNTGCAYNGAGACYSNGITIGSHPGDPNYGFQIVQNMWDDRLYFRRYNYGWQGWLTVIDSGNIGSQSVNYANSAANVTNLSGTWWGTNYFGSNKGGGSYVGSQNTYGLEAFSSDGGAAGMSFHRGGYYAVNMGLDPDNVLRIGGWSAGANRWQLDMSGNETIAGGLGTNGLSASSTYGVRAQGSTMGANFYSTSSGIYDYVAYSNYGLYTNGDIRGAGMYLYPPNVGGDTWLPYAYDGLAVTWNASGGRGEVNFNSYTGSGWASGFSFFANHYSNSYDAPVFEIRSHLNNSSDGPGIIAWGNHVHSDLRQKQDIKILDSSLEKIQKIRGVSFQWKEPRNGTARHYGVIAQEVRPYFPELVSGGLPGDADEMMTVSYEGLIPVTIEAIKEQQTQIDDLKARQAELDASNDQRSEIEALKVQINELLKRIEFLENRNLSQ